MNPSAELEGLMGKLGFATGEAMIEGLGLQGTIQAIADEAEASGTPIMGFLRRKEAVTLALAASGGQADVFKEKLREMQDVAGATDDAMKEITDGVNAAGFNVQQASAAWGVATQKLGESVAPVWGGMAVRVHDLAESFSNLSPQAQKLTAMALTSASGISVLGGAALIATPKIVALNTQLAASGGIVATYGRTLRGAARVAGRVAPWVALGLAVNDTASAFNDARREAADVFDELINSVGRR